MRHLPLLSSVRVETPCNENWDTMPGNERVRHCATCNHDVHDLSAMSPTEAEALLANTSGRLCVRIDTPSPLIASIGSRAKNLAAALGAGIALAACSPGEEGTRAPQTTPDTSVVELSLAADSGANASADATPTDLSDAAPSDSGAPTSRDASVRAATVAPKKVVPPKKFEPRRGKTMGVALRDDREL